MALIVWSAGCSSFKTPSPVCLAGAHLDNRGRCVAQSSQDHHLPFRAGQEIQVTQGFHGYSTHNKDLAYAVDFGCEEGTPITASRSGVVWSARKDSNKGCDDPACVDEANYVIIDHGDGTYASYFHLRHMGVFVEPGDQVCRGQLIGLCGATGYASGPHLHFSVMTMQWTTIPVSFEEIGKGPEGMPLPRETYESENHRRHSCRDTEYSELSTDAFIHRGIALRGPVRSVLRPDDEDRTMLFEGRYFGDHPNISIHRRDVDGDDWIEQCVELDEEGRFSVSIDWPEHIFSPGYYFLMLTGSDDDCNAPGWAWSYRIRVLPGEGQEKSDDPGSEVLQPVGTSTREHQIRPE